MNLLYWCEITENAPLPDFGDVLRSHIAQKSHPGVHASSLTAWNLLERALRQLGHARLPAVEFQPGGKPYFADSGLHFSISHSGRIAAALVSDGPCAVDVEAVRPNVEERLLVRCLSKQEIEAGCDFFEAWTKKECIGKLSGRGIPGHPAEINTLDTEYAGRFFLREIRDSQGNQYILTALCMNGYAPKAEKKTID